MVREQILRGGGIGRVFRGRRVGEDRSTARNKLDGFQTFAKRSGSIGHELAVERRRDREPRALHASGRERLLCPFHFRGRARKYRLLRSVLVGDDEVQTFFLKDGFDVGKWREHGKHRTGIAIALPRHEFAAQAGHCEEIARSHPARGGERHQFPVTVPGVRVGFEPEPFLKHPPGAETDGPDCGLGVLRLAEGRVVFLQPLGIVSRRRVDAIRESRGGLVRFHKRVEHLGKEAGEFAEHPDILRTLAGEHHRNLTARRPATEMHALRRVPRSLCCEKVGLRPGDEFRQVRAFAVGGEREPAVRFNLERSARRLREPRERGPVVRWHPVQFSRDHIRRIARQRHDLDHAVPVRFNFGRGTLFENRVKVAATETERGHRGTARMSFAR